MTSEAVTPLPPPEFAGQVRNALERLYDFPYLQSQPLAQLGPFDDQRPGEMGGQRLRRQLIEAIETLNPGRGVPFLSPLARLYNLLRMHYVDGMTVQKVAHELGISLRQATRNLRQAEESVATVLWTRQHDVAMANYPPKSVQSEVEQLELHPRPTDIRDFIGRAGQAVQELAGRRGVSLTLATPQEPVMAWADPVAAQQVMISLLSRAVQHATTGDLLMHLTTGEKQAFLTIRYILESNAEAGELHPAQGDPVIAVLARQLEWATSEEDQPDGVHVIMVQMPSRWSTLLVIDDKAGLAQLVERYLTGQPCQVLASRTGMEGLRMAKALLPSVIMLDVMMPELDGWEILRTLRSNPRTVNIPIVICSVLNNPDLASSLGAAAYLVKPIRRDDVVDTLRCLKVI